MMQVRRSAAVCAAVAMTMTVAAPAFAFNCGNASKPVGPGEKAVIDISGGGDGTVEWISKSWQNQLAAGKTVDQLHGGFLGLDLTGDGTATGDTYANPQGEVPQQAQSNGATCNGVVSFEQELACNS